MLLTIYSCHLLCQRFVPGSFCGGALVQLQLKTAATEWLLGMLVVAAAASVLLQCCSTASTI